MQQQYKFNYIMLNEVLDKLNNENFDEIIKNKIILLEDIEVIKKRYLQYLMLHRNGRRIDKIYLNLTNRCNSNCIYCFAHSTKIGYDMKYETVIPILSKIIKNTNGKTNICFFGGEPTLKFDLIKEIIGYIEKEFKYCGIDFDMITNGIDLSFDRLLFIKQKFKKITFSIDGNYNYMIKNRITNKEVLDNVYNNIIEACQIFENTSIRATITEYSKDIIDTYKFFKSLGAKKIRFKPVSGAESDEYLIKDWSYILNETKQLSSIVMEDLISNKMSQVLPYSMYIYQFQKKLSRITGCSMNIITISQNGELYPCYRFIENKNFLLNNQADIMFDKLPLNIVDKKNCINCWCKYICGGGCYADAYIYEEEINKAYSNHCLFIRETIKQSIFMYKNIVSR